MTAALFDRRSEYQQFTKRAKIKSHLTIPEKMAKKALFPSGKAINQCCVTFQLMLERNLLIFILKKLIFKRFRQLVLHKSKTQNDASSAHVQ